jgi:predicted nucleic acid-binding protein
VFLPESASLLNEERFDTEQLLGHRQVTDAYLLGLAVAHGLRLATFDANVAVRVVRGGGSKCIVQL